MHARLCPSQLSAAGVPPGHLPGMGVAREVRAKSPLP